MLTAAADKDLHNKLSALQQKHITTFYTAAGIIN